MKFIDSVDINGPIDQVVEIFENPANVTKWAYGLIRYEPLKGVQRTNGAKSKLIFQHGRKRMEIIETIRSNNLPMEFKTYYQSPGMLSLVSNRFEKLSENQTRFIVESHIRFGGFLWLISFLLVHNLRFQNHKHLIGFKEFVERII